MMVIGLDGATWKVIEPNLDKLPTFRMLKEQWDCSTLWLKPHPTLPSLSWLHSAPLWTSMFSGIEPEKHKHLNFVRARDGKLLTRKDVPVKFVWDVLSAKGYSCVALNVPFVIPPYSYNTCFKPTLFSLTLEEDEWELEVKEIFDACVEALKKSPDLFIVVFNLLDRVGHLHYGEPVVLEWYIKMDSYLGELIKYDEKVLICSDHGFDYWDNVEVRTTKPRQYKDTIKKGDHDTDAIIITNCGVHPITKPTDIYKEIMTHVTGKTPHAGIFKKLFYK